jgi:hypothetical protein
MLQDHDADARGFDRSGGGGVGLEGMLNRTEVAEAGPCVAYGKTLAFCQKVIRRQADCRLTGWAWSRRCDSSESAFYSS